MAVQDQHQIESQHQYTVIDNLQEKRTKMGTILFQKQKEVLKLQEKKKNEKHLELWKFVIELMLVFYTSSNVILMVIIPDKNIVSWIYSSSTVIRVVWYVYLATYLANSRWNYIKEFIRMDDLQILSGLCQVAYNFQNSSAENVETGPFLISAFSYFFLVVSFCGMFRCHLKFMIWTERRKLAYKVIMFYSIVYYMILGTITLSNGAKGYNKDLYLLYVFTYLGYLQQLLSLINGIEIEKQNDEDDDDQNDEEKGFP